MKIYEDKSIEYRKEKYLYLIEEFEKYQSLNEAHILSTKVFGVQGSIHVKEVNDRETENTNSSAYDEDPTNYMLTEGSIKGGYVRNHGIF